MTSLSRRNFLKLTGAAVGGGLVAATTLIYLNDESGQLSVEHIPIPLVNLPPVFEGFRIAQMSDFHLYPYTPPELIRQAVEITNGLKPDLTVLTGDFVWRNLGAVFDLPGNTALSKGVDRLPGAPVMATDLRAAAALARAGLVAASDTRLEGL